MIKFVMVLGFVLGISYFTFRVPLGKKTLWGHLVDIADTNEAQTLQVELKRKIESTKKELSKEIKKQATHLALEDIQKSDNQKRVDEEGGSQPVKDAISEADKKAIKRMINKKSADELSKEDRKALDSLLHDKIREHR
jgi:hypothetical protein